MYVRVCVRARARVRVCARVCAGNTVYARLWAPSLPASRHVWAVDEWAAGGAESCTLSCDTAGQTTREVYTRETAYKQRHNTLNWTTVARESPAPPCGHSYPDRVHAEESAAVRRARAHTQRQPLYLWNSSRSAEASGKLRLKPPAQRLIRFV